MLNLPNVDLNEEPEDDDYYIEFLKWLDDGPDIDDSWVVNFIENNITKRRFTDKQKDAMDELMERFNYMP